MSKPIFFEVKKRIGRATDAPAVPVSISLNAIKTVSKDDDGTAAITLHGGDTILTTAKYEKIRDFLAQEDTNLALGGTSGTK